jgi:hypothetical protein
MMVLNYVCKICNYKCNAIRFQQNFENWTSGNNNIDEFIQNSQQSVHKDVSYVLEWIPYNRFYNIKCIAKARMYRANWIDGHIIYWNNKNQNWKRHENEDIILKSLNNLSDNSFMSEV